MADITKAPPTNRIRPYLEQERPQQQQNVNVGDLERWASLLGGGVLALVGLSRRSLGGLALAALGGAAIVRGATGHCNVYGALGVNTAQKRGPVTSIPARHGVKVEESVTIDRSPEELFRVFRDFEHLPQFMSHLESVRTTGPKTSHWIARGPLGKQFEWDAEIHTERPNELISWRSLPGSEVDTVGSIHFLPLRGGRGTEVKVVLKYDPPTGKMGAAIAKLFMQSPEGQIREDLRHFKQLMEAGECPTTEGQPRGSCGR